MFSHVSTTLKKHTFSTTHYDKICSRWQSKRTCAHLLLWELQNYNLLMNNHLLENVRSHQKKKKNTPHPRAKDKPQQDGARRGKIAFRIKLLTFQRHSKGSNKPCVLQDPETPQRLSQNCVWVSPAKVWSAMACHRGRGSGYSRPEYGISPLGRDHH